MYSQMIKDLAAKPNVLPGITSHRKEILRNIFEYLKLEKEVKNAKFINDRKTYLDIPISNDYLTTMDGKIINKITKKMKRNADWEISLESAKIGKGDEDYCFDFEIDNKADFIQFQRKMCALDVAGKWQPNYLPLLRDIDDGWSENDWPGDYDSDDW